jgi:hypothetical protein
VEKEEYNISRSYRNNLQRCEIKLTDSPLVTIAGFCNDGEEASDCIKTGNLFSKFE